MTLTIELSDETARALLEQSRRESRDPAVVAVETLDAVFATAANTAESKSPALSGEDIPAIGRGLAASDSGDVIDADTFFNELYEKVGLPKPPPFSEAVAAARLRLGKK